MSTSWHRAQTIRAYELCCPQAGVGWLLCQSMPLPPSLWAGGKHWGFAVGDLFSLLMQQYLYYIVEYIYTYIQQYMPFLIVLLLLLFSFARACFFSADDFVLRLFLCALGTKVYFLSPGE